MSKLLFTTFYQEELWCHFTDRQKGTGLNNLYIARTHCCFVYCSFHALCGQTLREITGPASPGTHGQPRTERVSGGARVIRGDPRARAPLTGTQAWRRALPRLPIGAHAPSCHGRPGPAPWALREWTVPGHANEGLVAAAHWPALVSVKSARSSRKTERG